MKLFSLFLCTKVLVFSPVVITCIYRFLILTLLKVKHLWKTYLVQKFVIFSCCKPSKFLYFILADNIDRQTFSIGQMLYYNIIVKFNLHSLSNASSIGQHHSLIAGLHIPYSDTISPSSSPLDVQ